jgi:hypothetical protein
VVAGSVVGIGVRVVGTGVGDVVGTGVGVVGTGVGVVGVGSGVEVVGRGVSVVGNGSGVMSTVSLTIEVVDVTSGAAPAGSGVVHPLMKTVPITRTVKIPVLIQWFIPLVLKLSSLYSPQVITCGLYLSKYIPVTATIKRNEKSKSLPPVPDG